MTGAQAALDRLRDPLAEVSAHYLIGQDGTCWQMVDEAQRAWHAGVGAWRGMGDINSRSIGIELDNDGAAPFTSPLMEALEDLLRGILIRWSIAADGVIGHSDMAPGRKRDPGPHFNWPRLEAQGLAQRPRGTGDSFAQLARSAGYTAQAAPEAVLEAVRLRLRPGATGPLTQADCAALQG